MRAQGMDCALWLGTRREQRGRCQVLEPGTLGQGEAEEPRVSARVPGSGTCCGLRELVAVLAPALQLSVQIHS